MVPAPAEAFARHCTASLMQRICQRTIGGSASKLVLHDVRQPVHDKTKKRPGKTRLCSEVHAMLDLDLANEISAAGSRHIFLRRARAHPGPDRVGAAECRCQRQRAIRGRASLGLVPSVTVITPAVVTSVDATNCVAAVVLEHPPERSCWHRATVGRDEFRHGRLACASCRCPSDTWHDGVVLVGRQRNRRQNADDRNDDSSVRSA